MTPQQQNQSNFNAVWGLVQDQWNTAVVRRYQTLQTLVDLLRAL